MTSSVDGQRCRLWSPRPGLASSAAGGPPAYRHCPRVAFRRGPPPDRMGCAAPARRQPPRGGQAGVARPEAEQYYRVVSANPDRSQRQLAGTWSNLDEAHTAALALYELATGHAIAAGDQKPKLELPPQARLAGVSRTGSLKLNERTQTCAGTARPSRGWARRARQAWRRLGPGSPARAG